MVSFAYFLCKLSYFSSFFSSDRDDDKGHVLFGFDFSCSKFNCIIPFSDKLCNLEIYNPLVKPNIILQKVAVLFYTCRDTQNCFPFSWQSSFYILAERLSKAAQTCPRRALQTLGYFLYPNGCPVRPFILTLEYH